ncbi:MAG: DMT family transporter [Bauldia sp.]|uniref:DMT family transporter n=1 Tax=Bauldia sp. TaxID=2575872 RepID=UPI001DC798B8|nr:DMT family transporter [Bauldia sp.]MCB1497614.1 DMT family transporter [Bauldia sp.]
MEAPAPPADDRLRGILLIVVAAVLFAGIDVFSKLLAPTQSVGQIVWARYTMALPLLLATTPPSRWPGMFRTARPLWQIVRGVIPMGTSVGMVLAVRHLPLAEATVILFTAPFLVVALSAAVLREQVAAASWIAVFVGFAAVLLVARPGFSEFSEYLIFPLIGALFFALLQLVTRLLRMRGEAAHTTLAWTLATGCVLATPFAIATWRPVSGEAWLLMAGLGLVFGGAQALLVRAFAYAPAGVLTPFTYVQIIAAVVMGMIVFGVIPDIWSLIGIVMIIAAGVTVARTRMPS